MLSFFSAALNGVPAMCDPGKFLCSAKFFGQFSILFIVFKATGASWRNKFGNGGMEYVRGLIFVIIFVKVSKTDFNRGAEALYIAILDFPHSVGPS